jgi:hypothetical protein
MKNIEIIKQVIEEKLDVTTRKVVQSCYPDIYFDDQDENYQKLCILLVRSALYNLFVYHDFDQQTTPDLDAMARTIHRDTIFKNTDQLDDEPRNYRQNCHNMVQIALEYVLPAIRAEIQPTLQSAPRPRGIKEWAKNAIRTVQEVFRDGGG